MSEVRHTPGPWALDDTGWIARVDNGEPVCLINAGLRNDELPSQELADAHLIAAAPELLEALKLAVTYMERDERRSGNAHDAMVRNDIAKVQAAIAKAEGRS